MSLKNDVCSMEFARKLRGLGMKQESAFYWVNESAWGNGFALQTREDAIFRSEETKNIAFIDFDDTYSAFTPEEIMQKIKEARNDS